MKSFLGAVLIGLVASVAQAGWIVDQAFQLEGFGAGSGVTQRLDSHDVDSQGRIHSTDWFFDENGNATSLTPGLPINEDSVWARAGGSDDTYVLRQWVGAPGTGSGAVYKSTNGGNLSELARLATGYEGSRRFDVNPVNDDLLIGVNVPNSGHEPGRLVKFNSAGSQIYDVSTGSVGISAITYDDSGNAFLSDLFGVVYSVAADGSLTATGDALSSEFAAPGVGIVQSMVWNDGAFFFGVQLNATEVNHAVVLRLLDGETDEIARGDDEFATDIAFFGDKLFIPNVTAGDSLLGFDLLAPGDLLTVAVGDFKGELLGYANGPTPEPSSIVLLAGLLSLSAWKSRRKRRGLG
jgi:hypothetical protein